MMDGTDRHCRFFHRLLTSKARLYTEMITAEAIIHGDRKYLLDFDPSEHPVALQLGGSDPEKLKHAARIGEEHGYDEVNLNVGCPSDRVQSGTFGACLMKTPELVADCVNAMREAVSIPVTVKCRIGVDDQEPEQSLFEFVEKVAIAGCEIFIVHARKAWLDGLSPKENREVPPLDYPLVARLKQSRPDLAIILNGGIESIDDAATHLSTFDGVMLGRTAYAEPYILSDVDAKIFGVTSSHIPRGDVIAAMSDYIAQMVDQGVKPNQIVRHMIGLFHGQYGARTWRRLLTENGARTRADILASTLQSMPRAEA